MANTFINFGKALTYNSGNGILCYTCPAATIAIVLHLQVANVDGTNSADVSVHWTDDNGTPADTITRLCRTIPVPANTSLSVLTGKLVLEAGDTIVGVASADGDLELSGSVLEMS
jgi:hypothetical protein